MRRGARPVAGLAVDAGLPLTVVRIRPGDTAEEVLVRIDPALRMSQGEPAAGAQLPQTIVKQRREP
ncbi:hypothetical protein [Streptomyces sp. NPDC046978]|uniref:hypothetical protein n=1 Tax=unclassified Streptomyces TaxID=2593676 RepID=UPI0033DAF471